ncbi:ammonium transporter (diguanylate cyclase domain) [Arcobacter venerupis]|uniref:Ammonium transporter n=1 Tax=Arcobacter venerupis TaxID=1054033 RepID=A0AAE7BC04_9BACT|nr:ammonium transporter [Arcobacter venerupis]QKF67800.1 ammonium transporter (diguanylate cyclase domain) [Arcobacter venerupis]RWS49408.1 ammonium transporter [Arcobacter venerupis]
METFKELDLFWILVSGFLVFMMQLGFSLVETGVVRTKNTINVAMKNLIDTVFSIMFFWLFGFGLMFGLDNYGLIGTDKFLIDGKDLHLNGFFFFQAMFAATAITIVSGAVAERIKFNGYIVVAIIVSAIIYPIFGHWAWSENGWLKALGFIDFAGSTVVHSLGGWIGLAGAIVLGPRLGKFRKGKVVYFAPSNHNFIVFGVFILFFAWFGFNAGSLLAFDPAVTSILINTLLAGVFGGFSAWIITLFSKDKVGVEIFSFGIIAGLVGITAGCFEFTTTQSAFVGFLSSFIMHYADIFLTKKLKIDDPLSVVAIHGFVGAWGTIAVGFFAKLPENFTRLHFIYIQSLGVVVAFLFTFISGLLIFLFLRKINLLRVRKKHEVLGLNRSEHNARLPWVDTIQSIIQIMKTGNVDRKIYEERDTEIGIVSRFFNYLLNMLKQKNAELKKSNTNLSVKAYHDNLTKILNRNGLLKKLSEKNNNYILAIIDIDKFKTINDTYGHDVGDYVLRDLAAIISNKIRTTDIFARWGGEEFILVLDTTDLLQAQNITDNLRKEVENSKFKTVDKITVSIGVSEFKTKNDTFESVFKKADEALYQAKTNGRNRVYVY